jgi:hypothetical protein
LEIGSHFLPRMAWTVVLLFYACPHSWEDRSVLPLPAFFHWDGSPNFFVHVWPGTRILLISVSQGARLTGMSHQHLAHVILLLVICIAKSSSNLCSPFNFVDGIFVYLILNLYISEFSNLFLYALWFFCCIFPNLEVR